MAKNKTKAEPTMEEKREIVDRWLKLSFVNGAAICDELYGNTKGRFDATRPFIIPDDPNSFLYIVDDYCKAHGIKGEIDEFFNFLTIVYAIKHGIKMDFDANGSLTGYEKNEDETFHLLYNVTIATKGNDYRFRDVFNLYRALSALSPNDFLSLYPGFIESVRNNCKALKGGTVALPKAFIAKTIGDIVKQHGCKSVFNPFSGVGGLLLGLDPDTDYDGQESYGPYSIFARVIADAHDMEKASFVVGNPLTDWPETQYDAVIFNLPTDCYFEDYNNYLNKSPLYDKIHQDVFNILLERRTATKVAIGLVRFPYINAYSFMDQRKLFAEEGLLESVICLPEEGVFADSKIKTAIIVLDFENRHDTASFYRGEFAVLGNHSAYTSMKSGVFNLCDQFPVFESNVGKDLLESFKWKYISALYAKPVDCKHGEAPVLISDIASIIPANQSSNTTGAIVSSSCFKADFYESIGANNEYKGNYRSLIEPADAPGPCLLFRINHDGQVETCIIRKGEAVVYDSYAVYALRPKTDKVTLEYLAYVLSSYQGFAHYLTDCLEYNADNRVMDHIILSAKVPIIPDIGEQKRLINESIKKHFFKRNKSFNVIWASGFWAKAEPSSEKAEQQKSFAKIASNYGVNIISTPLTAYALEKDLTRFIDECTSTANKADAIFIDASLPMSGVDDKPFEGLDLVIDLKGHYALQRLPFYIIGDTSWDELSSASVISSRRLEYFKDRIYVGLNKDTFVSLLFRFQDDMDLLGSKEAELRHKYTEVFKAADRYNKGGIQRVLTEALAEEYSLELSLKDTQEKFNKLRKLAEGLLSSLAEKAIIPTMNFGAQVEYLSQGRYDDTHSSMFYLSRKEIIPNTLSSAFKYFKEIGDGGSHTAKGTKHLNVEEYVADYSKNSDLYKSLLYIFIDILLWYDRIIAEWELDPKSFSNAFLSVPRVKEVVGIVKVDERGVPFCEHTKLHDKNDYKLKAGDRVRIRKSFVENEPTDEIWFYATWKDYDVLA